jgi:hypothetical protein
MLEIAAWFFGAGVWFYIQSSIWESLFHEFVLDVTPEHRAFLFRNRSWLPALWHVHFDHNVLHHFRTYRRSYVEQFSHPEEEAELQSVLRRQVDEATFRHMVNSRYGATFTSAGYLPYAAPILLNLAWLPFAPSLAAGCALLAANLVFATPYFVWSKWVHLRMHCRFEEAMEAPWPLRTILASPYGVATRISHFVHHRDPRRNYNLQYFADRIRGRWRAPTKAEWDEMVAMGLVTPDHRRRFEGRSFLLHPF